MDSLSAAEMKLPAFILKYRWKLPLAVLALAVVIAFGVRWWRGAAIATETVARHDFIQTVVASGHVETPHRVDIGAQMTGTVLRVPVIEGQVVTAGMLLVELQSAELDATGHAADLAVVQAKARLRQLHEVQAPVAEQALREAQSNFDNAQTTQARNQDLFAKGFISRAAVDDSRKAIELAQAQVRSTQKQFDTTSATGSDHALAEAGVAGAEATSQAAHARTRYTRIYAPVGGVLISRNVEVGDVVQPGVVLMMLSPQGGMQLVVQIDEKNLSLLTVGQAALVSADAYPSQRFAAQLAYINPGVNAQTGAVEVKLDVPSQPTVLKQDMTVSVDIEVARRPNALLIPVDAVHDAETPAPWILTIDGHHSARHEIKLGLRSDGLAEVLDGVKENDIVIPVAAAVTAGARVRTIVSATTGKR